MRIYVPVTLPGLARAHEAGTLQAGDVPLLAHAVTPAVREWYTEGDTEELEFVAMTEAAQACLRMLAADPAAPRRRAVVAADVPDAAVTPLTEAPWPGDVVRSLVRVSAAVPLRDVASVHVDEDAAEPAVVAAIDALPAADAGDDDARFLLDDAEAHDLLWYDVTEIPDLL